MPENGQPVDRLVGHLFRHEAGRMAAVLTRMLGSRHLDSVDDVVQETLLKALEVWKYRGIPNNPTAWLFTVARRKAIDHLRSRKPFGSLDNLDIIENDDWNINENGIQDSVLSVMFAACHPSIAPESQVAFTLKTLGGLSVQEIAKAFMTSEETIAKRIYRAKEKLREENILTEPLISNELTDRLEQVLRTLYLLFNEGYYSSNPSLYIREDLCAEAMRLTYLLVQHEPTKLPQVKALLALMCLQASRFSARADDRNQIVLLQSQDRSRWNKDLINRGLMWLNEAASGDWLTDYHVEAAIASVHAIAPTFEKTNWKELLKLYDTLYSIKPSPTSALNRAIAAGYALSPSDGIEALLAIEGSPAGLYYHTALGDFYARAGLPQDALIQFEAALIEAGSQQERELLESKKSQLQSS